ncbi:PilW family protein [Pseudomonas spirodelae]|uniref:Prepilin-type N-terminal cleavage/methylation domain-containing protein n=1 Tax=Pseudomonas spirodelae TaxID=3101751 RepID=A0ABU5PAP1_9PSED|nr:prepilin-type N-terminal cleavage/methylation domain-containing protein [Pseudomonas sp. T5W1]MEA1606730.1 prepilin-type N-terminal cleavage/methylation domain-containing protein [Pseudomonas sp. T5W1]
MNMYKQSGLSLIEVMVAVLISSILILGVTDLFSSAFMSGRSNSELTRIQENGRLAMEIIGADARLSGLRSCTSDSWSEEPLADAVALTGTQKSLTLRFSPTCNPDDIQSVTYTFASNGLTQTKNGGTAQTLLDDVDGTFTLLPANSTPDTANAVLITVKVKSAQANFAARDFSSTYEFKNRLIARE